MTWLRIDDLHSKFAGRGKGAVELLAKPLTLIAYKDEWDAFVDALPAKGAEALVEHNRTAPAPGVPSALAHGSHVCAKWSVLETEVAFFSGEAL